VVTGNGINYHNGPVMRNGVNIYYIWYGNWAQDPTANAILTDFAINVGGSPYFNINTTYGDTVGNVPNTPQTIKYISSMADAGSLGTSLSDANIWTLVSNALNSATFPVDPNGVYFVLTAPFVGETSGFLTQYCGWHTVHSYGPSSIPIKYSFVGNPAANMSACAPQTVGPNGDAKADAMASVLAHELEEAATDPELNAWYDSNGDENADKCAWTFGTTYTANGAQANMKIGLRDYLIQRNWVNASGGYCALAFGSVGPPDMTITKTHAGQLDAGSDRRDVHHHGDQLRRRPHNRDSFRERHGARWINRDEYDRYRMDLHAAGGPCSRSDALAAATSYPAITLTVNVAANAPASVTNSAAVSGGGETNTGNDTVDDPTTIVAPPPPGTPFLTGFALNGPALRSNYGNFVGMKFTVGGTPLTVSSLGRICITGNSGTHTVKLVTASNGANVAGGSVSVPMAGCTAGQFKYVGLPAAVILAANTAYYVVSLEVNGGDQWYDSGTVSSTTAATVNNSVYFNGTSWLLFNGANTSMCRPISNTGDHPQRRPDHYQDPHG
jgi:hypothetical protein